jgi:single-stranded-DNA-specific exonuclease
MSAPLELAAALGGHPLVAEIVWQRGYRTIESARAFLDPNCYSPTLASELPDLDRAVARLREAIERQERIRVWGDFDVDGQTATSVLLLGLRELGANVDYTIPNRAEHSHGLNEPGIVRAQDEGVRVLLTCDCGVTDFEEIAFARRIGLDVIVSDHHDLARTEDGTLRLPDAVAVINPRRLPDDHPLADLPGVGVAYKLIEALTDDTTSLPNRQSSVISRPQSLLDLVALGIVADLATQRGDTRYLLQRGLEQLRRAPHAGVLALMRAANIDPVSLDAEDISYQIGPRLNAAGRLASAVLSVELLTEPDWDRARDLAMQTERLNEQRKTLQRAIEAEAMALLEREPHLARQPVIVLQSETWHPSVIGVVASAIVNRYRRPAILITVRPGEIGRGSARSVDGIDIHAAILAQGKLIEGGGGHPMAAGFSIRSENVAAFRAGVSAHVSEQWAAGRAQFANDQLPITNYFSVAWRDVSAALAEQIERLAPFGAGNPRPILRSGHLRLVRVEPLGRDGQHQMLYLRDVSGNVNRVAWWRSAGQPLPEPDSELTLSFTLRRDVYNGQVRAKIEVEAIDDLD